MFCSYLLHYFASADSIHAEVCNYKVYSALGNQLKTIGTIGRLLNIVAFQLKVIGKAIADILLIINSKNSHCSYLLAAVRSQQFCIFLWNRE